MRRVFLWAARNRWLKEHLPRMRFMRRAVRRFMPGETLEAALDAAAPARRPPGSGRCTRGSARTSRASPRPTRSPTTTSPCSTRSRERGLPRRDLGQADPARPRPRRGPGPRPPRPPRRARGRETGSYLWIDMEGSAYAEATIPLYERLRAVQPRTGICLQAYLRRTAADIERLRPLDPAIRLVKGAYDEPASIAYRDKRRGRRELPRRWPSTFLKTGRGRPIRLGLGHPRRRAHRADRRAGRRGRDRARRVRGRDAVRDPDRGAVSGWPRRATGSRRSSPTVSLVSVVHAPAGRAAGQRRLRHPLAAAVMGGHRHVRVASPPRRRPDGHHRHRERLRGHGPRPRARGGRAADRSTSRSASPTSTRRPTSARPPSARSTTARPTTRRSPGSRPCARRSPPTSTARKGFPADPSQVFVTVGGKGVMLYAILGLVDPGDEVIVPDPGYPIYESLTRFVGATPVPDPDPDGERLPARRRRARRRSITPRTRLLVINSPANPTGGVLTRDDLERIAELAIEHDLWVLADEIYGRILYDGAEHVSIASLPGMAERTIVLDGFSQDVRDDRLAAGLRGRARSRSSRPTASSSSTRSRAPRRSPRSARSRR